MKSDRNGGRSGGIGFLGAMTVALVVLKLTGHIAWSWWRVLAPIWAPIAVGLVLLGIGAFLEARKKK